MEFNPHIIPCLWFEQSAKEAVEYYLSIFPDSRIISEIVSYDDWPGGEAGDLVVIDFELAGQRYQALSGGPNEPFNERISLSITCRDQSEVDHYWNALTADGGEPIMCGWLKDKYGVRWQIVPAIFYELVQDADQEKSRRVMQAMLQMIKLDIEKLERAYKGVS